MATHVSRAAIAWRLRLPLGALGQALTEPLDLTDMGLALAGVSGDGVDGNIRGGGVEDEADCFPRDLSPL